MRIQATLCAALATAAAFLAGAAAPAAEYRDGGHNFTLTLPGGWRDMPGDAITTANNFARQRFAGQDVQYNHGFLPAGKAAGNFPYVLVQIKSGSTSGSSYDDIEKGLQSASSKIKRLEGSLSDVAKGLAVGEMSLDRAHNRVVFRLEMDVVGVGKVQAIAFGFIGAKGIVFVHCYDKEADFARTLPTFLAMADSFKYDAGYEFTPAPPSSPPPILRWLRNGTVQAAVIGAAVGGLVAAIALVLLRPRRKAPAEVRSVWEPE